MFELVDYEIARAYRAGLYRTAAARCRVKLVSLPNVGLRSRLSNMGSSLMVYWLELSYRRRYFDQFRSR